MTIEERLEDMEREMGCQKRRNRWLLGTILLIVGGLIAPWVFETTAIRARSKEVGTAKEIRARSFVLEDENGKPRAMLTALKDGQGLFLYDENGTPRAMLGVVKDSPALFLYDENGKDRAALTIIKAGPSLWLSDENGKNRAALDVVKDGPRLFLYDENGKDRAALTVFKDGPSLWLSDENGQERFIAGETKARTPDGRIITYPESSLILFGPDGKVIWSAVK